MPTAARDLADQRARQPLGRESLRVAVVGCGAVARANLLPVLAGHDRITVAALVDRDEGRARSLADAYTVADVFTDLDALTTAQCDAVVLATPPAHHAPATLALVGRGLHVFVEKPMAISSADAESMVEAARRAGVTLGVGLYRRFLPSVRLLKHLIETREFGTPLAVDIEEGGPYGWQPATLDVLTRKSGGGGVLIDIGSHLIDELLYVIPGTARLDSSQDNSRGGIETDCVAHVDLATATGHLPVRLELSRTRELRNSIHVECEDATLELRRSDFTRVLVHRRPRVDGPAVPGIELAATWPGTGEFVGYQAFRDQFDDWLSGIATGREPLVSGRSVLPVVRLIEECYGRRTDLPEPWTDEGLDRKEGPVSTGPDRGRASARPPDGTTRRPKRVLVTGAGGFLGGRTVEVLRERYGWDVVPLVRSPRSAARLARWPVDVALGDVCSPHDMARVVEGCDAVVHCAVGTDWPPEAARKVTVDGTRIVAEAALEAGVQRFVHISSLFVHDRSLGSVIDETTALSPPDTDGYGQAKLAAERALEAVLKAGLSAITLRPTRIYGPFSKTFTIRPLQAISAGAFAVSGGDVPANMVYVDNVVEAIARAVEAPDALKGSAYLINDPDQLTLREFWEFFARSVHGHVPEAGGGFVNTPTARAGFLSRSVSAVRAVATSPELRGIVRRVLATDPIGTWPRRLWESSPAFQRWMLRRFGADAAVVYRPSSGSDAQALVYHGEAASVSTFVADRELGVQWPVARERAMALTLEWAHHARLLQPCRE